jgi:hypothetical protein
VTVGMSGSIDGSESCMLVPAPEAFDSAAGVSSSNGEYERVSLRVMGASARSDCDARIAVMSASSWQPPVPLNTRPLGVPSSYWSPQVPRTVATVKYTV